MRTKYTSPASKKLPVRGVTVNCVIGTAFPEVSGRVPRSSTLKKAVPITQFTVTPRTGNFFDAGDVYLVRIGEPLGAIFGYQVTGLWQKTDTGAACYLTNKPDCTPGEYKVADLNGDGKITSADRTIL